MAEHESGDARVNLTPVSEAGRIELLDVLRGVAVLGILAMNIALFAMPFGGYGNPTFMFEYEGLNKFTYWVVHTLFDMKMMGLFSMLFGAGVLLYAQKAADRAGVRRARWLWLRRMGWLLLFGLFHAYVIWEGDILFSYAVCGLVVVWWLRRLPVWALFAVATILFIIGEASMLFSGSWVFLNEHQEYGAKWGIPDTTMVELTKDYDEFRVSFAPTETETAEQVEAHLGGYMTVFHVRAKEAIMFQTTYLAMMIFWRVSALMLIGMGLFKLGVLSGTRSVRFYGVLAAICYGIGLPLVIGGIVYNTKMDFDLGWFMLVGTRFNSFGAVPMAIGHIGLIGWIVTSGRAAGLGRALASTGRMALTNYLMQSVIASLVFYGYGLGMYGRMDRFEQQLVVLGIWGVEIAWSCWWLARFRFGPAEWLWRSLTYWRKQPMRRGQPVLAS